MASCNTTKSQAACMNKISPFLLLAIAIGDYQVVLLRSMLFLMSISPSLLLSDTHWPYLSAQHLLAL